MPFKFNKEVTLIENKFKKYIQIGLCDDYPLCIIVGQEEHVIKYYDNKEVFINSSVEKFLRSIYVYEKTMQVVINEVYGDYEKNRSVYAGLMEEKFKETDPSVFEIGYFWPSIIEGMYGGA